MLGANKVRGGPKNFLLWKSGAFFQFLTIGEKLNLIEQSNSIWYDISFYNDAKGEYTISQYKISKYDIVLFHNKEFQPIIII